jgi:ABC-type glutathione transport system ATPase component
MPECKIIAIRPLEGCATALLKVLTVDQLYVFYQEYKFFIDETGEGYEFIPKITPDLFKMGDIQINVSAVVGKNGSGKSSLVELLYAGLYNLACTMRLFKKDETGWGFPFEENVRFDPVLSDRWNDL